MDKDIFQILARDPNKYRPIFSLYNEYCKEKHSYVDKKHFIIICELLDVNFKNVKKLYRNGTCYLSFVTDYSSLTDVEESDKKSNAYTKEGSKYNDNEFGALDKCYIIEYTLDNPKTCSKLSLTDYLDGTNTIIHIVVNKGRYDLLNKLISYYDVDFDIKNRLNQTVFDVLDLKDVQNTINIIKLIVNYQINKNRVTIESNVLSVKQQNSLLLDQNKRLSESVTDFRNDNFRLKQVENENKKLRQYLMLFSVLLFGMFFILFAR
jgi:hypothetical protein